MVIPLTLTRIYMYEKSQQHVAADPVLNKIARQVRVICIYTGIQAAVASDGDPISLDPFFLHVRMHARGDGGKTGPFLSTMYSTTLLSPWATETYIYTVLCQVSLVLSIDRPRLLAWIVDQ